MRLVNYLGLKTHPQYELARRQMKGRGGMLWFIVPRGIDSACKVMNAFGFVIYAVTFGTSRTICMHPRTITHEHMTQAECDKDGIDDGLIRISVGLEDPDGIIPDLARALLKP